MNIKKIIFFLVLGINIVGHLAAACGPISCDPRNPFCQTTEEDAFCPLQNQGTVALQDEFSHFIDKESFNAIEFSKDQNAVREHITNFANSIKNLVKLGKTCKHFHAVLSQENLKSILQNECDIDIKKNFTGTLDYNSCEILHLAIRTCCSLSTIKTLVYIGADINAYCKLGYESKEDQNMHSYPIDIIVRNANKQHFSSRETKSIAEYLNGIGAKPSQTVFLGLRYILNYTFEELQRFEQANSAIMGQQSFRHTSNTELATWSDAAYSGSNSPSPANSYGTHFNDRDPDSNLENFIDSLGEFYEAESSPSESESESELDLAPAPGPETDPERIPGTDLARNIKTIKDKNNKCSIC